MPWSYEKPTKEGWYYANLGDVVTQDTCRVMHFTSVFDGGDMVLIDTNGDEVRRYNDSWKFLPVDFEELNKIGNE